MPLLALLVMARISQHPGSCPATIVDAQSMALGHATRFLGDGAAVVVVLEDYVALVCKKVRAASMVKF